MFSLASCFGEEEAEHPDKAFFDVVAESNPSKITTAWFYTIEGEKNPLNGTVTTEIEENGNFTFTYQFERIAIPGVDDEDPNVTIDGNRAKIGPKSIYCSNGRYFLDESCQEEVTAPPASAGNHPKLNITPEKLGEYTMNDAKTTLTTALSAEAAADVIGMTLGATSDVTIEISTNGSYLTEILITYTKGTANVKIQTSYQ